MGHLTHIISHIRWASGPWADVMYILDVDRWARRDIISDGDRWAGGISLPMEMGGPS
jgi:hypothetical protein